MLRRLARKRLLFLILVPLFAFFAAFRALGPRPASSFLISAPDPVPFDLEDVLERDTLRVLTPYTSTGYFLYRGLPMGFEYDLLREFADQNDLYLQMRVVQNSDSLLYYLNSGEGDVIAGRHIPAEADSARALVTQPLYETAPAIIQRTGAPEFPDSVDSTLARIEAETGRNLVINDSISVPDQLSIPVEIITRPSQLAGRTVHVPGQSSLVDRLIELEERISGDIEVVQVAGDTGLETLIRGVSAADVDYVVAPEALGRLQEARFDNIMVHPTFGDEIPIVFLTRRNAPALHAALDLFLDQNPNFRANLFQKYYIDRRGYRERIASAYLTSETGVISPYDELIKRNADKIGWDWRLLASQMYQESRFRPRARSWAGAMGLLQLMPATARDLRVRDAYDPEQNVDGAVRYLEWLDTSFWSDAIPDSTERIKFILASYNAGAGHVGDARRLAEYHGDNPNNWEEVAYWLLQKSKRKYYRHPVVRYGYCRGLEPVTYVSLILDRYEHYRQWVASSPPASA